MLGSVIVFGITVIIVGAIIDHFTAPKPEPPVIPVKRVDPDSWKKNVETNWHD